MPARPRAAAQLKVVRDNGFATVRPDGARRLYALATEIARGRREGRTSQRPDHMPGPRAAIALSPVRDSVG